MLFLTFSNAYIDFVNKELIWGTYSITKALSIIKKVQIINWNEYTKAVLDPDKKAFVIYIATMT